MRGVQGHFLQRGRIRQKRIVFMRQITSPERQSALPVESAADGHAEIQIPEGEALHMRNDVASSRGDFKVDMEGGACNQKAVPSLFPPDGEVFADVLGKTYHSR